MQVTIKDIQDYWRGYCERHGLDSAILAEGMRRIALNPDYWADHTMVELRDVVIKELNRH